MDAEGTGRESNLPDAPECEGEDNSNCIVVGVGASAGGLEAFTELVSHLPRNTGLTFVLVQHLDPHHESALPELLAVKTPLPVIQVENNTRIAPDHIYVIPPNKLMRIQGRTLILEARPAAGERYKPIDIFFTSLSLEFGSKAVGVVLSGTATDGTLGLKAIKAEGGITFAQNQTAKFDSMPRSAIAAGVVDFVLSPRRIAEELVAIAHQPPGWQTGGGDAIDEGATLHRLLLVMRSGTGVDFTQYKQPTIQRRLNRRMTVRKSETLEQYLDLLRREPGEIKALFDDLLINVSDFFRDPDVFLAIRQVAFPTLIRNRKPPHTIRVWIPGCSSGEEVYSMAIAFVEYLESEDLDYSIQLFGTDLSDRVIEKARTGIYDEGSVMNVSPQRLQRFFVGGQSGYQISRSIREMCIFSRHDVTRDPPLSRMDLISCRNLLIYFIPSLQRRVIATFAYALQPHGCLVLGPSETLGNLTECFGALDERHKIYLRNTQTVQALFSPNTTDETPHSAIAAPSPRLAESTHEQDRLRQYVNKVVLSQYGPAGVVVDEDLRIAESRGNVEPYLAGTPGETGGDLMNLLRPDMRAAVSTAIERARRMNAAVVAESVAASGQGKFDSVAITVVPLALKDVTLHFLVLFGHAREETDAQAAAIGSDEAESAVPPSLDEENSQLKQELRATREYLQSVIEELRSTNEEIQSANEELQSTNEELQTAKEELQSSNEELHTVNDEMHSRNADLMRTNDDLNNLLSSINTPIVMTGGDLRIRRFTPTAESVLRLIPTDIGRPIADLKPRINVQNLEEILRRVVDTLEPWEQEVQDTEGRLYLMRVRPYRTADNRIDGSVLQLLDVTELRRGLEETRQARDYAEAVVNTVREPLVVLDQDLAIHSANRAFCNALGVAPSELPGKSIYGIGGGRFDLPKVHALIEQLRGASPQLNDIEIEHPAGQGETRILSVNARRIQEGEQRQLILMAFEDITERRLAAQARYRRLFESARDGIVLVDAGTGEIIDVNPFTERLFGYRRHEIIGRKVWEIEPMRKVPRMRALLEQIRELGMLRLDDPILFTKDGRGFQAEVIASVYPEKHGQEIQFNIRDVSERRKFERELQETQKLESLGLLAGGIAHDFNNILTGVIGNASIIYSELPPDQPMRKRVREVINAGERAAFLTRQMLAYAGKGRTVSERIDLGELVREISALVQTSIPKSVELKLDLAPDLPPLEGDPSQIQQVIMNLVINAGEAIGKDTPGKVRVRTSLREIDQGEASELFAPERTNRGNYLQLEVVDTGSGMDEATKARIFDPFFTTKFTGRGLGLAAVQGIVRTHGGAIRVYSTPGQGTSFLVLLPAADRAPAPAPPEPSKPLTIPPGSVALVIDDEEPIRSFAGTTLSRAGMKVLLAENGKIGVEMFRAHKDTISVVVLDLLMPVIGGKAALAELKEINSRVPIILSSGFDENEAARGFSAPQPERFLQKPYTAERLIEAIAGALNQRENSGAGG